MRFIDYGEKTHCWIVYIDGKLCFWSSGLRIKQKWNDLSSDDVGDLLYCLSQSANLESQNITLSSRNGGIQKAKLISCNKPEHRSQTWTVSSGRKLINLASLARLVGTR